MQFRRCPLCDSPTRRNNPSRLDNSRRDKWMLPASGFLSAALALGVTGCHKTVSDATLTTNVTSALHNDAAINQQPVQVAAQKGVVTLTGNVSDDTASTVAAQDAARVTGVKEVVNDLTVAGIAVAPTVTSPAAPTNPRPATTQEQAEIAQSQTLPPPADNAPPPPQPTYHDITVTSGKEIPVRIDQSLDSQYTQPGATFNGVVTREVLHDGYVVIPAGSPASGRVVEAHDAAHFKGHSLLAIELTAVRIHGNLHSISTDAFSEEGKNRGTNSAEKIGGGAVIGAVLGGIFGGGKGAAIGAAAGGGGGAAVQGFTRGQQVTIPSESLVRFHLRQPFTVRTSETPSPEPPPGLQRR
jgi:hypothetical protein